MDSFKKQPYEQFTVRNSFSKNFGDGEVVTTQTVSAIDKAGVDVSAGVVNQATVSNDGKASVQALVMGGSQDASPYKLTFRCVTSHGHQWENDIQMIVIEL